ncbi:hypothetical protein MBLNU230_g0398t1 [Neophaeotheca triangularis]
MPPSGRKAKGKARKAPAAAPPAPAPPAAPPAPEQQAASDAETPEAIPTPTRTSRKRARASEAASTSQTRSTKRKTKDTREVTKEDTEGTEHEQTDDETVPSVPTEQEIIQHLKAPDRQVNATEDFANDLLEGQENVPGYGKIAGRDWAFIIRKVEVNVGRPEAMEKLEVDAQGRDTAPSHKTVVDIDLGPDRQVSRSHAVISYDPDSAQWLIIVNGRNGVRVDNNLLKRGTKSYLRNGSVIEIAGVQMAFITTATDEGDGPIWDASIIRQAQKSSEDDDDGEDDMRNGQNGRSHAHPPARSHLQDQSFYQPDFRHQQHQQQQEHHQQQQRMHPHSHRAAMQAPPGTPLRNQYPFPKSSPAANYSRGVMMESTETIDYSSDQAKDLKPPHSYAQLIGMAILSTQEQAMTLSNIYKFIMANYAFYRFNTGGWQNSIRHNLSLNKAFTKIARRTDEPGKGMKWMIEASEFDTFVSQGMKGCRRPVQLPATQTTMDSPSSPVLPMRVRQATPPLARYNPPSYPTATEAYTPDRGPRRTESGQMEGGIGLGINGNGQEVDFLTRSTPRNGLTAAANAAGSPPALYINEENRGGPIDTPFPLRPTQRFAPPSTLKRPSDFIQFSSPAPFWKMDGLVGSTPFKPYDLSPLKTPFSGFKKSTQTTEPDTAATETEDHDAKAVTSAAPDGAATTRHSPVVPSSSPPRASSASNALEASPTLSRPATAVAKTLSQMATSGRESTAATETEPSRPNTASEVHTHQDQAQHPQHQQQPRSSISTQQNVDDILSREMHEARAGDETPSGNGKNYTTTDAARNSVDPSYHTNPAFEPTAGTGFPTTTQDDDDEGIDLVKGFQPIGAFHRGNHLAASATAGAGAGGGAWGR